MGDNNKSGNTNLAIIVIGYNRLNSIRRLLNSLLKADYEQDKVPLIISLDKSDSVIVPDYIKTFEWPYGEKKVILHEENLGLRKHVLWCGSFLEQYESVIVLEDDLFVSPQFYNFAKFAILKYASNENIAGISLYSFATNFQTRTPFFSQQTGCDVFFMNCAQSWGQIWLKQQWKSFMEWYKNNSEEFLELPHLPKAICNWPKSSWLKYHIKYCIEKNKYFVYPYHSFTTNFDDAGSHSLGTNILFQTSMLYGTKKHYQLPDLESADVVYDVFFERKKLATYLGVQDEDLCVDFYGMKENRENKRFWLSTRKVRGGKIIKTYGLQLKPYEMNVIYNIEGEELILYDTKETDAKISYIPVSALKYMFGIGSLAFIIRAFGLWNIINVLWGECFLRIKKRGFKKII